MTITPWVSKSDEPGNLTNGAPYTYWCQGFTSNTSLGIFYPTTIVPLNGAAKLDIPVFDLPGVTVTKRALWRTLANGSDVYKVADIAANTALIYIDKLADTELSKRQTM